MCPEFPISSNYHLAKCQIYPHPRDSESDGKGVIPVDVGGMVHHKEHSMLERDHHSGYLAGGLTAPCVTVTEDKVTRLAKGERGY